MKVICNGSSSAVSKWSLVAPIIFKMQISYLLFSPFYIFQLQKLQKIIYNLKAKSSREKAESFRAHPFTSCQSGMSRRTGIFNMFLHFSLHHTNFLCIIDSCRISSLF